MFCKGNSSIVGDPTFLITPFYLINYIHLPKFQLTKLQINHNYYTNSIRKQF